MGGGGGVGTNRREKSSIQVRAHDTSGAWGTSMAGACASGLYCTCDFQLAKGRVLFFERFMHSNTSTYGTD